MSDFKRQEVESTIDAGLRAGIALHNGDIRGKRLARVSKYLSCERDRRDALEAYRLTLQDIRRHADADLLRVEHQLSQMRQNIALLALRQEELVKGLA